MGGSPSSPLGLAASVDAAADFVRSHASLHTFMTDRIDRLRPSHQLTLKARPAGTTYTTVTLKAMNASWAMLSSLEMIRTYPQLQCTAKGQRLLFRL